MMVGNFNAWISSLKRHICKCILLYWKKVGKHSFQMRKMTICYFNKLKSGEGIFFFLTKYSSFKLEKFEVKKKLLKTLWPLFIDGVQLPQG